MASPSTITRALPRACSARLRQRAASRLFSLLSNPLRDDTPSSHLPRIAQPSLWSSLIPKAFRARSDSASTAPAAKKGWNPATIFIVLGVLVGSNAIQMIGLRREMLNFSRQTDARLAALREVVQKVKNGEPVDVRRVLGTGDEKHEAEWEEVVKELESTDMLWEDKVKRDRRKAEMQEQKMAKRAQQEELKAREQAEGEEERKRGSEGRKPRFLM